MASIPHSRAFMEATIQVMRWEMYAPGTVMAFSAVTASDGFRLMLERDLAPVISGDAADTHALFRVSKDLRTQLMQLGFTATPQADRVAVLGGGPCWGPATALHCSLLDSLR